MSFYIYFYWYIQIHFSFFVCAHVVLESEVEQLMIERDKLEKEKVFLNEQLNEDPDLKK